MKPATSTLQVGDPRLRRASRPVNAAELATADVQHLIDDLVATMRAAGGAGLAATQIGADLRISVIEVDHNARYPYKPPIPLTILVNPVITPLSDELFANNEGSACPSRTSAGRSIDSPRSA